ncbi:hypothetical protein [Streptomyces sp. NPDC057686]|uniref:hypothetical protein n=1 Tax=Streptomyces sp. NPDC057686 TaxID=3346212 RepID=UPI0036AA0217
MTVAVIGHFVRVGLLVYLGGEVAFPDVHLEQVAVLARRRDLPALVDQHVPLGPNQAAIHLRVRRRDFDEVVHYKSESTVRARRADLGRMRNWRICSGLLLEE